MERLNSGPTCIRVVIAEMPQLLADIVRETVANERDMKVVGEFSERRAMLDALAAGGGDVVIVGTFDAEASVVPQDLLATSPYIRVLVLQTRQRRAVMYEWRPHRRSLGDVSPQRLVQAIRLRRPGVARG